MAGLVEYWNNGNENGPLSEGMRFVASDYDRAWPSIGMCVGICRRAATKLTL